MIWHLAYVGCDLCGAIAQPADCNRADSARDVARGEGFGRSKDPDDGKRIDLCGTCTRAVLGGES